MVLRICSKEKFANWLDEHYWFEDCNCLSARYNITSNSITLELGYQIAGGLEAYSTRTRKVVELEVMDIIDYIPFDPSEIISDHCMEGIELYDNSPYISFVLDVPKKIGIICKKISIQKKPDLVDTVKPFLGDFSIVITVKDLDLPGPDLWIKWFAEYGVKVVWRLFGGEAENVKNVPTKKYVGWFLQDEKSMSSSDTGLFFFHVANRINAFDIYFHRWDFGDEPWNALKKILLRFQNITIKSGNCTLSRAEWQKVIENNGINGRGLPR